MSKLKRIMKYMISAIVVILIILIIFIITSLYREMFLQKDILPIIESEIGFELSTPPINDSQEVIRFHVKKNSIAEQAGLMDGDILIEENYATTHLGEFANSIYQSRGKAYSFNIKRGANIVHITIPKVQQFRN
ncbi:hypothetical protein GF340_04215 [Candidatus Peregrinibacteria bacterium]|nr:hypothetical protein [Candidatus Peregrinibacteria bacterium]